MNKKITFTLMILSILFLCGSISAADVDLTNETLSADNDLILEESSTELNSNADFKTFKDLNEEITNKTQIDLDSDYTYTVDSDNDYKNGIVIDKTVVINGHGFKINSTNESRLFDVKQNGNLVLNDLILLSNYGNTAKKDASFKNAGNVTLNNVTFITTQTKLDELSFLSSSFYNEGRLNIINSNFVNSTVTTNRQYYYGIIYNIGTLNIENTIFDNNRLIESSRYVKDIYATNLISNEKKLTLNNVNVTNNYMKTPASILGLIRGIESSSSNITINNSFFNNNKVEADETNVQGTIIWTKAGTLTILNSKFTNTSGARSAGVIHSLIPNILINNTFEKNIVSDSGDGGVIYTQGTSTFINNTFKDNYAKNGGAIYCTEDLQASTSNLFKGNVFINNKAGNQGGAIYSAGNIGTKTCPIEDNVFINNEAGQGGAIFLRGSWTSKSIFATKSIFQENFASEGGSAIYNYMVSGSYIANITCSIFYDNYGNIINAGRGSSAEYNYWGTNTPEFTELTEFTPTHIAIITISGDENIKYGGEYSVNFKDNVTSETLQKLPNFTANVQSTLKNTITPKSIVISNGEAILEYDAKKTGNDNIKVVKDGKELANLKITVLDIIKTPSFNITAKNVKEGESLDLKFILTNGPEGNDIYSWSIFDENNTLIETGFMENNQIKYTKTYSEGKYLINIKLNNVEGWENLEVSDSFEVLKVTEEPSTNTTGNQTNTNTTTENQTNPTGNQTNTNTTTENQTNPNNQGDSSQKQQKTTNTKKITPKIIAKKKTFKSSKKVKTYTITLKVGKNPLKKVKVTLKIKGKTYTATTNKNGKATFKIKKLTKKGKYKAIITYKGNKTYNKVTKKVTITIKK